MISVAPDSSRCATNRAAAACGSHSPSGGGSSVSPAASSPGLVSSTPSSRKRYFASTGDCPNCWMTVSSIASPSALSTNSVVELIVTAWSARPTVISDSDRVVMRPSSVVTTSWAQPEREPLIHNSYHRSAS